MSNITQLVNTEKHMTILKKGIIASGLNQLLSSTGPFTVFAPSDIAFEKLESGILETLLQPENKSTLTALLNSHVVAGKINAKDLKDGDKLKTLSGKELMINITDGKLTVDGIAIRNRDLPTSNGVVHSMDDVLKN